jgi:hypothetical protein
MSMPDFPPIDPCLSQESALNMILHSIALEEVALSHVINAEGEKIQAVIASMNIDGQCCFADMQKLLEVNKSVHDVLEQVKEMQMLLKSKMSRAIEYLPKPEPPLCPEPEPEPPPCFKPKPPCFCKPSHCPPKKICFCKCDCCMSAQVEFFLSGLKQRKR